MEGSFGLTFRLHLNVMSIVRMGMDVMSLSLEPPYLLDYVQDPLLALHN